LKLKDCFFNAAYNAFNTLNHMNSLIGRIAAQLGFNAQAKSIS